jgi:putative transposase
MNYLHFNPVKHGWVRPVSEWPHSRFHRRVQVGIYPEDWASQRCGVLLPHDV